CVGLAWRLRGARTAGGWRSGRAAGSAAAYLNLSTLSLVTISVPVSTFGGTVSPRAALTAVSMPIEPIFAGNCATDAACSPALIAVSSPGDASKPTTVIEPGFLLAALMACSAPLIGGPHAP